MTKLRPPFVSSDLVERPQLIQRLEALPNRGLTLISAPAGYGKTTLAASWLRGQQMPYAWISLDEADNDPGRFLRYVNVAMQRVFPGTGQRLSDALNAPDLPSADLLTSIIINEISLLPKRIILVLDDYHTIHNRDLLQLVERFLNLAQDKVHTVIISRVDPLLPLPRLRLQQGMVEIRQKELRFSDEEAAQLLQTPLAKHANADFIARLNHYVDGWIAGLRLAVLSGQYADQLSGSQLESSAAAQGFIADYLFTEVLAQQPAEIQAFLLQTAFVDRFSRELGQELLDFSAAEAPSEAVIAHLQRANLFLIPLDDSGIWFRYHHLFQQMLRQKAAVMLGKDRIKELHKRAGDWFARQGFIDEALGQYLAAEDIEPAAALIEKNSRNLLNNLARQRLEQWMALLPDEIIWNRPRLLVAKAWLHYRHWQLGTLSLVLDRIRDILQNGKPAFNLGEEKFILGQLYALRGATIYCRMRDFSGSILNAERALSSLPETEQGALGTVYSYYALSLLAEGNLAEGQSLLNKALADPAPYGPARGQLFIGMSFVYLTAGDMNGLHRVTEQYKSSTAGGAGSSGANWVASIAHYESNQLNAAEKAFLTTTSLHYTTNFLAACDSWLGLARICQIQGDLTQAQRYLDAVRAETLRLGSTDLLLLIDGVQAYQQHLAGDTAGALRWAAAFDPQELAVYPLVSFHPLFFWARILAAHGEDKALETARQILIEKLGEFQKNHDVHRQVQVLAHLALLENRMGNMATAVGTLKQAVRLAQVAGYVRSIVDCGPALRPLLGELQRQDLYPHYLDALLSASAVPGANGRDAAAGEKILTRREEEILRMMGAGFSNKEIAYELVISLYTVKRHASNIYRKLDVTGRIQAVDKAQQSGILD